MKNETTAPEHLTLNEETTEASHLPLGALEELHRHWALFLSGRNFRCRRRSRSSR